MKLGHSNQSFNSTAAAAERNDRVLNTRKRALETELEKRNEKLKRLDECGHTVDKIFTVCTNYKPSDEEKEDRPVSEVSSVNLELPSNISFGNSDEKLLNEEPTKSDAKTQTFEFDYLFKENAKQEPFTEAYFRSDDDKVKFYTRVPCFDILMTTFNFVSPHSTRRSPSLSLFQEFIMVLMKLRLYVPLQDLAYRFDISLSTVSRIFLAWMTVVDIRLSPLISWPECEDLWRTMPKCFQYSFGQKNNCHYRLF